MRRILTGRLLILAAVLVTLQYGLAPFFTGRPDFLYLLVLDSAFFLSWERVPFLAAGIGLLRDLLGGHLFGIQTFSFSVTGTLLSLSLQKLERENALVRAGITLLFVALTEALSFGLGAWLEEGRFLARTFAQSVFWTTFYTALVGPAFFWFTSRWFKRISFFKQQYELF